MHQWKTGNTISSGTSLHYYRSGGSKPPIVLAHGITDDGLCWNAVARVLSENYDVIMVDARGHGKSDAPDQGYDYETMATELAGLITELGLHKPALLGHSMGAATVLALAGLFPDLPGAILLEDTPPIWDPPNPVPGDNEHITSMITWISGLKRKTRDELLAEGRQMNPTWPDTEFEAWVDSKHRFSPKTIEILRSDDSGDTNYPTLLKRITCPVVLITADTENGAILGKDDVKNLKSYLPHLVHEYIPGAGHNIRREQFPRYMEVVQQALADLPQK